jgi:MoxR-like ATPase
MTATGSEAGPDAGPDAVAGAIQVAGRLFGQVSATVRGKPDAVRLALVALLSGGHLLVEDIPGTGKTLLGKSLAAAIGGRFGRIQCTPDLLPADLTGTSVFAPSRGEWEFRPGPVFANVLLLDEVNRASPRTQAALLEPMEEHQVTVDGSTHPLPDPFFCIATQNPLGQAGTFPLPESQLDRFSLILSMGWPDRNAEREILTGVGGSEVFSRVHAVTSPDELRRAVDATRHVHVVPAVLEYVLDISAATRTSHQLALGASPRATLGLLHAAQAHAVLAGRHYVTPDDVQAVVIPAFAHRVWLDSGPNTAAVAAVLRTIIGQLPVPVG